MFTYGFYNSLNGDRKYNAEQMSSIFDGIIEDGVYSNVGELFAVIPGTGLQVIVKTGRAWFNHTWNLNDSWLPLNLEDADPLRPRIDSVVIEVNSNLDVRENSIKVVKGSPATNPVPPTMTHSDGIDQYRLADITVSADAKTISEENIANKVGQGDTPFVTAPVQSVDISDLYEQWNGQFQTWFANVQAQLEGDVVTNLQKQIDDRVKIADKATKEDVAKGTPGKWIDAQILSSDEYIVEKSKPGDIVMSLDNLEEKYPGKFIACDQRLIPEELAKDKTRIPSFELSDIDFDSELKNISTYENRMATYPLTLDGTVFFLQSNLYMIKDGVVSRVPTTSVPTSVTIHSITVYGDKLWVLVSESTKFKIIIINSDGVAEGTYAPEPFGSAIVRGSGVDIRFVKPNDKDLLVVQNAVLQNIMSNSQDLIFRFRNGNPMVSESISFDKEGLQSGTRLIGFEIESTRPALTQRVSKTGSVPYYSSYLTDSEGNLYTVLFDSKNSQLANISNDVRMKVYKMDNDSNTMNVIFSIDDLYNEVLKKYSSPTSFNLSRLSFDVSKNTLLIIGWYAYSTAKQNNAILLLKINLDSNTFDLNVITGSSNKMVSDIGNIYGFYKIGDSTYMIANVTSSGGQQDYYKDCVLIKVDVDACELNLCTYKSGYPVSFPYNFSNYRGYVCELGSGLLFDLSYYSRSSGTIKNIYPIIYSGITPPLYLSEKGVVPSQNIFSSSSTSSTMYATPYQCLYMYIEDGKEPTITTLIDKDVPDRGSENSSVVFYDDNTKRLYNPFLNLQCPLDKRVAPYIPNGYMRVDDSV